MNLNTCIRNRPASDLSEPKLSCLALIYPGIRVHSRGGTSKDVTIYTDKKKSTEESDIFVLLVVSSFNLIKEGGEILICDLDLSILDAIHKVTSLSKVTASTRIASGELTLGHFQSWP